MGILHLLRGAYLYYTGHLEKVGFSFVKREQTSPHFILENEFGRYSSDRSEIKISRIHTAEFGKDFGG